MVRLFELEILLFDPFDELNNVDASVVLDTVVHLESKNVVELNVSGPVKLLDSQAHPRLKIAVLTNLLCVVMLQD